MNALELAIEMEREGRQYYLDQAEINKDSELSKVFLLLADSEKEHEDLLRKRLNKEEYAFKEDQSFISIKSVFNGLKEYEASDIRKASQLDVYRLALDIEEKSIDHYLKMLEDATEDKDKELFKFLIKEEKQHMNLFDKLVEMLTRPDEWVESPEFGLREDY